MANTVNCTPEDFAKVLRKAIKTYGDDVFRMAEESAKTAARQGASELKKTSPVGAQGRYARGWSHKGLRKGLVTYTDIIYNRTDYQLTHLLEKPHNTGYGGKYPKRRDHTGQIARVEEKYGTKFYEGVVERL